ncbi:hypothetical protein FRC08_010989 [Ceratobasidium sp. 394]|nr:hypothetical protein FRC08_010989 [Ceratobasidium sp. 394]
MEYRLFTGDDKGQIKSIVCEFPGDDKSKETRLLAIVTASEELTKSPIQRLRCHREPGSDSSILAAAQADGMVMAYAYTKGSNDLQPHSKWKEVRMTAPDKYIGLEPISGKGWLTCTQHGRLRLSNIFGTLSECLDIIASLPMRLNDLRLSSSSNSFAYGGNEVDLSVWDTERTFSEKPAKPDRTGKKRKKGNDDLMYAEIWRAKQLPNDSLSLRQPVHITSLAFLRTAALPESQQPNFHIVTGNKSGAVRRFDTRTARRPVANWEDIAKTGGIKGVECGRNEHEIFVSDNGSNLSALDVRTGKVCYSYKGLAGAISSFTPVSTTFLASVSLDRMFRIHSVFAPPPLPKEQQLKKGTILAQEFLKSTPTAVAWDGYDAEVKAVEPDGDEDVWEGMQIRGEEDSGESDDGREVKRSRQ